MHILHASRRLKKQALILFSTIIAGSFFFILPTQAAVRTWDGGGGDTNWSTCTNWSDDTCPGTFDVATFDATSTKDVVVDTSISVQGIDINTGYSGTITQATGSTITTSIGYAQDAGIFIGGASAISLGSTFTLAGGSFTSTSSTLTVRGAFTHSAGTFTHNNGTLIFASASNLIYNSASTLTFNNVEVNITSSSGILSLSSDTMQVNGILTLTNGRVDGGTMNAKNAVSVAATWDVGGTSTLLIDGTATATMTIAVDAKEPADTVTVNNANYTVVGSGSGTIIFDKLNLQAGSVNLSGFTGTFAGAVVISGGTYTQGSGVKTYSSNFSQSGGIFDAGSSTTSIAGTLALSGGTHTFSSDTTTLRGNFTHTNAPTMSHNNGSVVIGSPANFSYNTASTLTFNNLEVNISSAVSILNLNSDTMRVDGSLTLTKGVVSSGVLDVRGSAVTIASTFGSGTATMVFGGSAVTTFTLTGAEGLFNGDITVNKSGGAVELASTLTLDASGQDLVIEEGAFDLNGNDLTVNGTSGTLVVQDGGNWRLQGGETITANSTYPSLLSGSIVTYDGTDASYTLKDYTYHHLVVTGGASSAFALAANESLGGNLTITSGVLDQATFTLAVTGTFSNEGTLRRRQSETFTGTMDIDSGTVEYVGDGDGSAEAVTITDFGVTDYYSLRINDTNGTKDVFSIAEHLSVAGTLQVSSSALSQGANQMALTNLAINGGTLTGGSSSIEVQGYLSLSSGTLTATTNTLSVYGDWTHTGGSFNHNDGSVSFIGLGAAVALDADETFYDLTLVKNHDQTLAIQAGDTLIVENALLYSNGMVSGGTVEAQGNVMVAAGYDGGTSLLMFSGGAEQNFILTGAVDKFNADIEVAKSSGAMTLGSALDMDAAGQDFVMTSGIFSPSASNYALSIAGNLTVAGGTFNLGASTVDIDGNLTVAGGTMHATTDTLSLAGDFALTSGTFTHNSGVLTLDGASQEISGAPSFGTLNKTVDAEATLTLPANTELVIATLNLQGSEGGLLLVRSSVEGTSTTLNPATVIAPNYLDVQDSTIETPTACYATLQYCVDSGNNQGWIFRQAGGTTIFPVTQIAVTVMSPNGAEEIEAGSSEVIRWTTNGNVSFVNIFYSPDAGETWDEVVRNYQNSETYTWTVPETETINGVIKVEATDMVLVTATDISDAVFSVINESTDTVAIPEDSSEEERAITERIAAFPVSVTVHGLVKLPDDGNPETQADSAVYYVGADGMRHAFPNEQVYRTWFCSFDDVQEITATDLATLGLGVNVTYRPGTRMVKFQSVSKVYAVDAFGTLRWVTSEDVAVDLYGEQWNTLIDDIPDTFYGNYTFGQAILSASSYDATEAMASVMYPSDNIAIPGYSPESAAALECE